MELPSDVVAASRHNARSTGIDESDALSFTAQAWSEHPDPLWRTVAHRDCVDERRKLSGRPDRGATIDQRPLAILDETYADGSRVIDPTAEDPNLVAVEVRHDLATVIGDLPDAELAALARRHWLGLKVGKNSPAATTVARAMRHARARAVAGGI